MNKDLKNQT